MVYELQFFDILTESKKVERVEFNGIEQDTDKQALSLRDTLSRAFTHGEVIIKKIV